MITRRWNCKFDVYETTNDGTVIKSNRILQNNYGFLRKLSSNTFGLPVGDIDTGFYKLICGELFKEGNIVEIIEVRDELKNEKGRYKITEAVGYPLHSEYNLSRIENG
jgi:hypothetical protein